MCRLYGRGYWISKSYDSASLYMKCHITLIMVTIKIADDVKSLLNEYKLDDESFDDAVNRLLDDVGSDMSMQVSNRSTININVSRDTMKRIKSFKVRENEPYTWILLRALLLADH